MKKVWNITDHPRTGVTPHALVLFGKRVIPGRYVKVEDAQLKGAHKLQKDIDAGLVYVGEKPPTDYATLHNPPRATLPKGHVRSHGPGAPVPATPPPPTKGLRKLVTEKPAEVKPEDEADGDAKATKRRK